MADTNDSRYKTGNPLCDAVRFLKDASFAVLPADAARQLGEFEKNFWGGVRWFAEKNIGKYRKELAQHEARAVRHPDENSAYEEFSAGLRNGTVRWRLTAFRQDPGRLES